MKAGDLGKVYKNGEVIVRQGEVGDCMYVILDEGKAEVIQEKDGKEIQLAILGEGAVFGEMSLIEREVRSATVRALGEVRVLTVDRITFFRWMHEDPSVAFRVVEIMSRRIRELSDEIVKIKSRLNP